MKKIEKNHPQKFAVHEKKRSATKKSGKPEGKKNEEGKCHQQLNWDTKLWKRKRDGKQ